MTISLNALCASKGIAIGKIYTVDPNQIEVTEHPIAGDDIEREIQRFLAAVEGARAQLRKIRERIPESTADEIVSFIDTHLLMLQDSALTTVPAQIIRDRGCNAEWALKLQRDELVAVFEEIEDPYLRTRKDDVDHVVTRIQRLLLHHDRDLGHDVDVSLQGYVVLADDLTPADIVLLEQQGVAGFITEYGGATSHAAILARSLRLPAIVGMHHARAYLRDDDSIVMDGRSGVLLVDPDERILQHYQRLQKNISKHHAARRKLRGDPTRTRDGRDVVLHANIELPEDVAAVKQVSAEGVGLFRTEYLYMNRPDQPSEEEQFASYSAVVRALKGKPVTIRTLDIGGDKPGQSERIAIRGQNPALGLRAVRMCLRDPGLFEPQLRAILRASAYGSVRMMLPMLSNLRELTRVRRILETVKASLRADKLAFDENMPIGAMIEVPAAAVCADLFAQQVDFLSIGTNDLIQYTMAADRMDDEVNYLYDPLHPAVLRLLQMTLEAGRRAGIPVAMCGDMAANARYTRLLLGLGLTEFSVPPNALLEIKQMINASDAGLLEPWAQHVLEAPNSVAQAQLVDDMNDFRSI